MKLRQLFYLLHILIIVLWHTETHSETQANISVGVTEIPFLLGRTPAQRGPYNDAIDEIRASGHKVDIVYLPPARAEILYAQKDISCLFPGSLESVDGKEQMIESNPLAIVHAYIFSLNKPKTKLTVKDQLVAIRRGFTFGGIRKNLNAKFVEVDSEKAALQFLLRRRVDAIIGYLPDLVGAQKALNLGSIVLHKSEPVYSANEAFICHKTIQNSAFVEDVNALFPLEN